MSAEPADTMLSMPDVRPTRLEEHIFAPLAHLRRRGRLYLAINGAVGMYLALLGGILAQMLLDWGLKLGVDQRAVLSALLTAFWLWIAYRRLLIPLLRSLSDRSLAMAVDRAHPALHDLIAAAVQFSRGQVGTVKANSPQLVRAVIDEACEAATGVSFMKVLNHKRARQRAVELAGLLLASAVAAAVMPRLASTWIERNWLLQDVPWPQQTYITPIGFDERGRRRVPRGDELEIVAVNSGRVPNSADLRWSAGSGRSGAEPMTWIVGSDRWEVSLGLMSEDLTFRIVGGDERTREYVVQAIDRPRVVRTSASITPPAYTGLDQVTLEQQTVLEVLDGSRIELEVQLNRPVESARFIGATGEVAACEFLAADRVRMTWDAPISGSYSFELIDRDGWTNTRPVRYTLNVVPDLPPEVRLVLLDVGRSITPTAELPVELSCQDAYGLGGAMLKVQRGTDPPFEVPFEEFEPGRHEFNANTIFAVGSLDLEPGDRLRIWAEADDQHPQGPNVGRSEPVELRVVTPADFLAELAGRELELRREFERLISAQRGLTDAVQRLLPELPVGAETPTVLGQRLAGFARRQDADAKDCLSIGRRFGQMLAEMRINKVARAGDERRIGERIIDPLEKLGAGAMPAVSAAISDLRREPTRDVIEALPGWQDDVLRQMREILANMLEWEGYREAVALLREIIDAQTDVRSATIEALQRQLDEILELEEPVESEPAQPSIP